LSQKVCGRGDGTRPPDMDITTTSTTHPTARRIATALLALVVALVALGIGGGAPAGAATPGFTKIVGHVGYDMPGPTGHHRLIFSPDNTDSPITGLSIERWNADKTEKLTTYGYTGPDIDPTYTISGMPDGVVFQYRVKLENADGWGNFGDFEPIKIWADKGYHRPFQSEADLVDRQISDFLGPDVPMASGYWQTQIDEIDDVAFFLDHLQTNSARANRLKVVRLYFAYFDRAAEPAGLDYWQDRLDTGTSTLSHVSSAFAASPEFKAIYGNTTNQKFVTLVYQNVLFRNPAPNEVAYWKGQLDQGLTTRGKVMIGFSESAEGKLLRKGDTVVADLWATMMREPATPGLLDAYSPYIQVGGSAGSLAAMLLPLNDYSAYYA
ncbi:MAG TPA: DUF4214 domain-containing protein, partial [Iamia sp.]